MVVVVVCSRDRIFVRGRSRSRSRRLQNVVTLLKSTNTLDQISLWVVFLFDANVGAFILFFFWQGCSQKEKVGQRLIVQFVNKPISRTLS